MDNSSIMAYRGEKKSFKVVLEKLKKAELPVKTRYDKEMKAMHFDYDGKCDGNTAHYLEKIIVGLIYLYKSVEPTNLYKNPEV